MSLLMDALKKAEETKKTHQSSNETRSWTQPAVEETDLPKEEIGRPDDLSITEDKPEELLLSAYTEEFSSSPSEAKSTDWDEQWLPEFVATEEEVTTPLPTPSPKEAGIDKEASTTAAKVTDFSLQEWQHLEEKIVEKTENPQNSYIMEASPLESALPQPDSTQETPATAQRILTASAPSSSSYRTTLIYGLLVIILATLGGGYYYYYTLTTAQSPFLVVQPLHRPVPPAGQRFSQLPAPPKEPTEDKKVVPEEAPRLTSSTSRQPPAPQVTPAKSIVKETVPVEKTIHRPPPPRKEVAVAEKPLKAASPENPSPLPKPAEIRLQKTLTQQLNSELSIGYTAFLQGDNKTAQRAYYDTLEKDPNNRDALLGLAAIAMRQGNTSAAQRYYQQILQLYPQDVHAQVGLITTLDYSSAGSESQLKLLLEQSPQSSYIHFSLGNLYTSQGRWAAAQAAYFEAYRRDSTKADYAYNLAVSLDQLNQPTVALNYYQKALQLAKNQTVNFNLSAVQRRLQTLLTYRRPATDLSTY